MTPRYAPNVQDRQLTIGLASEEVGTCEQRRVLAYRLAQGLHDIGGGDCGEDSRAAVFVEVDAAAPQLAGVDRVARKEVARPPVARTTAAISGRMMPYTSASSKRMITAGYRRPRRADGMTGKCKGEGLISQRTTTAPPPASAPISRASTRRPGFDMRAASAGNGSRGGPALTAGRERVAARTALRSWGGT